MAGHRSKPLRMLDRPIGSPVSDSLARYRDAEMFGADVREASGDEAANRRS